ncbi:uncharacterized protein LOC130678299 [Microplitis mediator]|uniref:uncharacterized protein LOC130678299 n=1 Tax=Microplitis mediator TaxID=375433 RepID=UPI002552BE77|nr:uncharacterized protein LOC130678299 [Microplitis mediator]
MFLFHSIVMRVYIFFGLICAIIGEELKESPLKGKIDDIQDVLLLELGLDGPSHNIRKIRQSEQSHDYDTYTGLYANIQAPQRSASINNKPEYSEYYTSGNEELERPINQYRQQKFSYDEPNSQTEYSNLPKINIQNQLPAHISASMLPISRNQAYALVYNDPNLEKTLKSYFPISPNDKQNTGNILSSKKLDRTDYSSARYSGIQNSPTESYQDTSEYGQYHVELTAPKNVHHSPQHLLQNLPNHQPVPFVKTPPTPYIPQSQYVKSNSRPSKIQSEQNLVSVAQAQAQAEAQALAFQKFSHSAHLEHQRAALNQIRLGIERHEQQTALDQINHGDVSDAGREHIEKNSKFLDPQSVQKAQLINHLSEKVAENRKNQEATEYKAHSDAIIALQKQQAAHLKAQEDAHIFALNFERNQVNAQARAQELANAQAVILYKAHRAAHVKAQNEATHVARAQAEARYRDPEHTPVIQYLLPERKSYPELRSSLTQPISHKN